MLKRNFWIKLLVVLIVQVLLLTQVDFALAASFDSIDGQREAIINAQIIKTKHELDIAFTQLSLPGLSLVYFDIKTAAKILKSFGCNLDEFICIKSNFIPDAGANYYAHLIDNFEVSREDVLFGYVYAQLSGVDYSKKVIYQYSTAPPLSNLKVLKFCV